MERSCSCSFFSHSHTHFVKHTSLHRNMPDNESDAVNVSGTQILFLCLGLLLQDIFSDSSSEQQRSWIAARYAPLLCDVMRVHVSCLRTELCSQCATTLFVTLTDCRRRSGVPENPKLKTGLPLPAHASTLITTDCGAAASLSSVLTRRHGAA